MLQQIITQMLQMAKETGAVQRRKLKSGLHITIIQSTTHWKLILWRDKVYPSEQEWETVLKHWAYPIEMIKPEPHVHGDVKTLRGEVPTQKIRQQPMFE